MQQAEEDLLVIAAQQGNERAFDRLFKRYHKPLLRFAYKLAADRDIANDAVQDTWIKSTSSIRRLKDPRAYKSWLYRSVKWRVVDIQRQRIKRNEQQYPSEIENLEVKQNITIEDKDGLSVAINQLPPVEKQIIHLFYLDEMTLIEISLVLEIAVGTVKSRLNRARKMLKQKFENQ